MNEDRRWTAVVWRAARRAALGVVCAVALVGCPASRSEPPPLLPADPPESDGAVPGAGTADFDRGVAYLEKGLCDQAVPHFERALAAQPDKAEAAYYLALCQEKDGEFAAAEAGYRKALELDGSLVEAALNLGALYLDPQTSPSGQPRPEQAIEVLADVAAKVTDDPDLHENLAFAYRLAKKYPEAIEHYEKALKLDSAPRRHFAFGDLLYEAKRHEQAVAHLEKALPGYQQDADTLGTIALLLGHCHAYPQCIKAFDAAIALKSDLPEWYVRRGICRHELGDEPAARRDYDAALAVDSSYPAAHYYLGMSWLESKDTVRARRAFGQAIQHGGDGPWAKRSKKMLAKMGGR